MLRDDNMKPVPRPMPRREPVYDQPRYEKPEYDDYDCPRYERPRYDYPMMPELPNNMNPCPYPDQELYELHDMMRRNPEFRRCVMNCAQRYGQDNCRPQRPCRPMRPNNPCRPMPRNSYDNRDTSYGTNTYEYDNYDRDYGSYGYDDYSETIETIETYDFSQGKKNSKPENLEQKQLEKEEEI